jgi:hypothetical protein
LYTSHARKRDAYRQKRQQGQAKSRKTAKNFSFFEISFLAILPSLATLFIEQKNLIFVKENLHQPLSSKSGRDGNSSQKIV